MEQGSGRPRSGDACAALIGSRRPGDRPNCLFHVEQVSVRAAARGQAGAIRSPARIGMLHGAVPRGTTHRAGHRPWASRGEPLPGAPWDAPRGCSTWNISPRAPPPVARQGRATHLRASGYATGMFHVEQLTARATARGQAGASRSPARPGMLHGAVPRGTSHRARRRLWPGRDEPLTCARWDTPRACSTWNKSPRGPPPVGKQGRTAPRRALGCSAGLFHVEQLTARAAACGQARTSRSLARVGIRHGPVPRGTTHRAGRRPWEGRGDPLPGAHWDAPRGCSTWNSSPRAPPPVARQERAAPLRALGCSAGLFHVEQGVAQASSGVQVT